MDSPYSTLDVLAEAVVSLESEMGDSPSGNSGVAATSATSAAVTRSEYIGAPFAARAGVPSSPARYAVVNDSVPSTPQRISNRVKKTPKKLQSDDDEDITPKRRKTPPNKTIKKKRSASSAAAAAVKDVPRFSIAAAAEPPQKKARPNIKKQREKEEKLITPLWLDKYSELKRFHKKFGHTRVPQNKEWGPLARWIYFQKRRRLDRTYQQRKLTQTEIAKLDKLGFDWTFVPKRKKRTTFEEYCMELEGFKKKYGNLNVPRSTGKWQLLGDWLYCMKRRRDGVYKRCRQLTPDQIARLEGIGINWDHIGTGGRHEKSKKKVKKEVVESSSEEESD